MLLLIWLNRGSPCHHGDAGGKRATIRARTPPGYWHRPKLHNSSTAAQTRMLSTGEFCARLGQPLACTSISSVVVVSAPTRRTTYLKLPSFRSRAACQVVRSSSAKNLSSQNILESPGGRRMFKRYLFGTTFASSSPLTPARQSDLCGPSQVCTAPAPIGSSRLRAGVAIALLMNIAKRRYGGWKRSSGNFRSFSLACEWRRTRRSLISSWPSVAPAAIPHRGTAPARRHRRRTEVFARSTADPAADTS
jgi:hypothetical protein